MYLMIIEKLEINCILRYRINTNLYDFLSSYALYHCVLCLFMTFHYFHIMILHDIQIILYVNLFMMFRLSHTLILHDVQIVLYVDFFMMFRLFCMLTLHNVQVVLYVDLFMMFRLSCTLTSS